MSIRRLWIALLGLCLALLGPTPQAMAHSASNSYLTVAVDGAALHVQWEIALRDLDDAIGIDPDGKGIVTWGNLKSRQSAIIDYALSRLTLQADGADCKPGAVKLLADRHGDGAYAVLRFNEACPAKPYRVGIRYTALFDIDPQHRGLLNLVSGGLSRAAVLSPAQPSMEFDAQIGLGQTFGTFFHSGINHILGGWDHMLFVAMLLLPAMFRRRDGTAGSGWQPVSGFWPAFRQTIQILTAFTIGHTLSLTCVVLGLIEIPARIIEGAIALTIVATAIDNVFPILGGRRWAVAFGFGLIHGLGFASSLGPLSLPPLGLAIALLSFNLGVEAAQLSVAAVVLPTGYFARNIDFYRRWLIPVASGGVGLIAAIWYIGRSFDVRLMPF